MSKKLTPEEVKSFAITSENRRVQIPFTESEIAITQDSFFQNSLKLNAIQEEFSKVAEGFKAKIKELKLTVMCNLIDLRNGYNESEEKCFLIDDQENGVMEYYTEKGDMVFSRPLRPDERQTDAFSSLKKVK
jgi:hypothetical protein